MEPLSEQPIPVAVPATRGTSRAYKLLTVAWMSLVLGLGIELLLLGIAAGSGGVGDGSRFVADFAQKVTWSSIVCIGLACGAAAARARGEIMGLMGLISAPIAFIAAKAAHKGAQQALSLVGSSAIGPSPYLLAGIKALEYALLGWLIARIARQNSASLARHAITGAWVGAIFGGTTLWLMIRAASPELAAAEIATRSVNELLFPMGCSIVLYAADVLGKKL